MNPLQVEVVHKSCAFVIHLENPLETLKKLSLFFVDRRMNIENLNMHRYANGEAMLIIHCQLEKDRVHRTT